MWPLPVRELHMAGRSSSQVLNKLGIHTIGELANTDVNLLVSHLKSHGRLLWEYANGIDDRPVESLPARAKGVGNSTTLSEDVLTERDAAPVLRHLSESVAKRLRAGKQLAGSISVEIKYADFSAASESAFQRRRNPLFSFSSAFPQALERGADQASGCPDHPADR